MPATKTAESAELKKLVQQIQTETNPKKMTDLVARLCRTLDEHNEKHDEPDAA